MLRLRLWRLTNGFSQSEAARRLGMSQLTYGYLESGRLAPSERLRTLLRAFFWGRGGFGAGARSGPGGIMTDQRRLPLTSIVEDDDNQPRLDPLDDRYIDALSQVPELWPPISVVDAGEGAFVLVDGFHRMEAARRAGLEQIDAVVLPLAADTELRDLAFDLNSKHGRPLSLSDRCAHAEHLLRRDPRLSDREVGRRAGVAAATAARVRRSLESDAQIEQSNERLGADGRTYTARAPQRPLGDLPDASLGEMLSDGVHRLFTPPERREMRKITSYLKRLAIALADQYEIDSWQRTDDIAHACTQTLGAVKARELAGELEPALLNVLDVSRTILSNK